METINPTLELASSNTITQIPTLLYFSSLTMFHLKTIEWNVECRDSSPDKRKSHLHRFQMSQDGRKLSPLKPRTPSRSTNGCYCQEKSRRPKNTVAV